MKTALIGCSEEHLSSLYSDCTALAKQENSDKEQVFKCYIKVLVGNTVKQCAAGNINIYSRPSLITLTLLSRAARRAARLKKNESKKCAYEVCPNK